MSILDRIADALHRRPAPKPEGVLELERALADLAPSTERLRRKIEQPPPGEDGQPDLATAIREARRNLCRPLHEGGGR